MSHAESQLLHYSQRQINNNKCQADLSVHLLVNHIPWELEKEIIYYMTSVSQKAF